MKYKMRKVACTPFDGQAKLHEECGVFGVYVNQRRYWQDQSGTMMPTPLCLHCSTEDRRHAASLSTTTVLSSVIRTLDWSTKCSIRRFWTACRAPIAVGHVRYSTTGHPSRENAQPVCITHCKGNLAITHNGNLVNAGKLRRQIELDGGIFRSSSDTEVLAYTTVRERLKCGSIEQAVLQAMGKIEGAYSLAIMSPRKLLAARDPHGSSPLCIAS